MTPEREREIRAAYGRDRYEPYSGDVADLLAEIDRLRAELAELREHEADRKADSDWDAR